MLANSEALSDHQFQVGDDITNNVFACNFLRLFVFEGAKGRRCERNSQTALAKWIKHRRAQARAPIQLDPKILEPYVGQYQLETPPNRVLTVSREGSRLFVDIPRNYKSELFAESESKFFLKVSPVHLTFIKDERQVTHMEGVAYGQTLRAKGIE